METSAPFSPIALVGTIALLSAYLVAGWCVGAGIAGNARKSTRLVNSSVYGLYAFAALIGVASTLMIYAFATHDFSIKYVAATSDVSMSTAYKVTAFWGGLDGSLLFWVLVLSIFSTIAIAMNARRHREMIGYVVATIMVVQVFFISLLIFTKNPFATYLTDPPADGQGLNPLLQNYWMVIHPPTLYVGFVAATIPFAFGIGALASGRLDDLWLGSVRVWMLICFLTLSVGLVLGGRWAYEELGWGGYWAWDPVENAGFIPWFTATAFLHSAIIQEQRGGMKIWNLALVVLTFLLTIFGTFMTRSGVVQSVHAFGEDNVLALQFIVFMAVIAIVSVGLIVYRAPRLSSKTQFESFMSREFAFLVNNWILLVCAFFVLFATMFPTISEGLDGTRVSVGIPFFDKWMTFFGLVLLFLAGAAPLLAWRKTTLDKLINQFLAPTIAMLATVIVLAIFFPQTRHTSALFADAIQLPMSLVCFGTCAFCVASIVQEFWRGTAVRMRQTGSDPFSALIGLVFTKHRKFGGYIVHFAVAIMFFGFAGKAYDRQIDKTIQFPAIDAGLHEKRSPQERLQFLESYIDLSDGMRKALDNVKAGKTQLAGRIPCEDCTMSALPPNSPSAFSFGDYTFLYERLITRSDDHKSSVTAQVSIWKGDEQVGLVYPAKWDYRKGSEATTEVAIRVFIHEDVYVVLTGYDVDSQLANFRVYVNPLISWVWIGTIILFFGTIMCIVPLDRLVRRTPPSRPPLGSIGSATMIAVVLGGVLALGAGTAQAASGEHIPAGMGMGDAGTGYPAMNRPDTDTAKKVMQELRCPCGCPRESIFDCKCGTAAKLRGRVLENLKEIDPKSGKPKYDLTTAAGQDHAYEAMLDWYVEEYNGEHVLLTPRSKATWILPTIAVVGGLGLLLVVGWRFTTRGRAVAAASAPVASAVEDDEYADKLDDELANTD